MRSSWNKMLVVAALVAPMVGLVGCKSDGSNASGNDSTAPSLAQPVAIAEGVSGSSEALDRRNAYLFKSQDELEAMDAASLYPGDIDFDTYNLVVLASGQMPTGGHWVRITSISQVDDTLYVSGLANQPGEDEMVTQEITYPYHAVLIEKTDAELVVPEVELVTGKSPNEAE